MNHYPPNVEPDANPNSGDFIINQLKRCGSDLSQEHEIYFYLYFPSENLAQQAAHRVQSRVLQADVSRSAADAQWLCLVSCPQIPDEKNLDLLSNQMERLATEYLGKYDGWEASLETE